MAPGNRKNKKSKNDGRAPDTTKALGLRKKRSTQTSPKRKRKSSPKKKTTKQGSKKFVGPRWRMLGIAENTCHLDSVLVALYVPLLCRTTHKPYPDLAISDSLLHRSFNELAKNDNGDSAGQRPLCKGCGLIIQYDDHSVRHKYW